MSTLEGGNRQQQDPLVDEPSPAALAIYERLRARVSPAQLLTLREDIERHVGEIRAAAKHNELLPLDVAEQIATHLVALLAQIATPTEEQQSALLGAALYFVSNNDEVPDTGSVLGLDDDAAIFNHVARQLGRDDLVIEF